MVLGGGAHGGAVEQAQSIMFTKARLVRRNLCSRSRESVGWGSGRECEEAVRRYSHLREFMFQGVKVNIQDQWFWVGGAHGVGQGRS